MRYDVIYTDPPWSYDDKHTGGTHMSGSVDKYEVLSHSDIMSLDVPGIAEDHSVVFLWCTTPLADVGHETLKRYGYRYVTKIYWQKTNFGFGRYYRVCTEELLVGVKGRIVPFGLQLRNYLEHAPLEHSHKPEAFRRTFVDPVASNLRYRDKAGLHRIADEREVRRIELFATYQTPGWTCLGNKIDGKDIRVAIEEVKNL